MQFDAGQPPRHDQGINGPGDRLETARYLSDDSVCDARSYFPRANDSARGLEPYRIVNDRAHENNRQAATALHRPPGLKRDIAGRSMEENVTTSLV